MALITWRRDVSHRNFLPLKPRTDLALINGVGHILIKLGFINREYIEKHTTGFEDYARFVEKYDPPRFRRSRD